MPPTTQQGPFPQSHADARVINLGLGQPSPRLLPLGAIGESAARCLGSGGDPLVLQYGALRGPEDFRRSLAEFLTTRYRHSVHPDELLVTGGTSMALSVASQVFGGGGSTVVTGDPTYFLARGIFETERMAIVGVPVDAGGLDVDDLESRLESGLRPALVYCIPAFHNPSAVCLQPARGWRLVELAERHDFIVIADEPYNLLHFGAEPPPCMMSYDQGRGRVLSLGSFSKILGPGLRLGWAHAAPGLIERLSRHGALRSGGGFNPLVSAIVQGTLDSGFLPKHVDQLRSVFRQRAEAFAAAIARQLPRATFEPQAGGYFQWLDLGQGIDTTRLLDSARQAGVAFTPGARCAVSRDLTRYLRSSVAFYEADELETGVARLAAALAADD